jgi:hypothetical protein
VGWILPFFLDELNERAGVFEPLADLRPGPEELVERRQLFGERLRLLPVAPYVRFCNLALEVFDLRGQLVALKDALLVL